MTSPLALTPSLQSFLVTAWANKRHCARPCLGLSRLPQPWRRLSPICLNLTSPLSTRPLCQLPQPACLPCKLARAEGQTGRKQLGLFNTSASAWPSGLFLIHTVLRCNHNVQPTLVSTAIPPINQLARERCPPLVSQVNKYVCISLSCPPLVSQVNAYVCISLSCPQLVSQVNTYVCISLSCPLCTLPSSTFNKALPLVHLRRRGGATGAALHNSHSHSSLCPVPMAPAPNAGPPPAQLPPGAAPFLNHTAPFSSQAGCVSMHQLAAFAPISFSYPQPAALHLTDPTLPHPSLAAPPGSMPGVMPGYLPGMLPGGMHGVLPQLYPGTQLPSGQGQGAYMQPPYPGTWPCVVTAAPGGKGQGSGGRGSGGRGQG